MPAPGEREDDRGSRRKLELKARSPRSGRFVRRTKGRRRRARRTSIGAEIVAGLEEVAFERCEASGASSIDLPGVRDTGVPRAVLP
jgi:hypothetical protein